MQPVESGYDDRRAEDLAAERLRDARLAQDRSARRHCANFAGLLRRDPLPRLESAAHIRKHSANARNHDASVPRAAEHSRQDPGYQQADARLTNGTIGDSIPDSETAEPKAYETPHERDTLDREFSINAGADESIEDVRIDPELRGEAPSGRGVTRAQTRVSDFRDPRAQMQRIAAFACLIEHAPTAYEFQLRLGHQDWLESVDLALTSLGQRRVRVRLRGRESSELSDAIEGLRNELAALGLELVDVRME